MYARRLRHAAAGLGETIRARVPAARRTPPLAVLIEGAARVGYGARGFVYLSAGALTLLAALDRIGDAVGTGGTAGWLAEQPFGRVWLVLLGLGLWAWAWCPGPLPGLLDLSWASGLWALGPGFVLGFGA